jgi:hypothetical protein
MTKLSDIYDLNGRAKRMQTRREHADELFRELAFTESEGATEECTGVNIDKVSNGYQVSVHYQETGRGYDYPKHNTKRMVFTNSKSLLTFVKSKMGLSKSEAVELVAAVDGGEQVELNETVGEPRKNKLKRISKKYRKHISDIGTSWDSARAKHTGPTARYAKSGGTEKWIDRAHRLRNTMAKAGGKGGTGGKAGAGRNLSLMQVGSASKTRQHLARSKKKGRTEKFQNKLRRSHTASMNLAKHWRGKGNRPPKKESFLIIPNLSEAGRSKDPDWKVRRRHQINRYGKMIKKHIVPGSNKRGETPSRSASEKAQKRAIRVRGFVHKSASKWNKDTTKGGAGGRIRHEPDYMDRLVKSYGKKTATNKLKGPHWKK